METFIVVVHVIVAIAIVGLVLLQQGKGADAGAAFGAGASNTVFGSAGTGNFLTRSTTVAATVFFGTSLILAIYAKQNTSGGIVTGLPVVNTELLSSDVPQVDQSAAGSDVQRIEQPTPDADVPVVPDPQ